jgi:hypothetical protein
VPLEEALVSVPANNLAFKATILFFGVASVLVDEEFVDEEEEDEELEEGLGPPGLFDCELDIEANDELANVPEDN